MFFVVVQVVLTPRVHVEATAQVVHGMLPEAEKVLPATHGTLHAVSVFVVQAALTPAVHVAAAAQALHGMLPEVEKVWPASHGGHLSADQSSGNIPPSRPREEAVKAVLFFQASAILRLLQEVRGYENHLEQNRRCRPCPSPC